MEALQKAAVSFCLACICSELVTLWVGSGWAKRCIKAVAGLYILIVLFQTVPLSVKNLKLLAVPSKPVASIGDTETAVLLDAQTTLEQTLAEECWQNYGEEVELSIVLGKTEKTVCVCKAEVSSTKKLEPQKKTEILEYLSQELGFAVSWDTEG